jgi:hypothetical protein
MIAIAPRISAELKMQSGFIKRKSAYLFSLTVEML